MTQKELDALIGLPPRPPVYGDEVMIPSRHPDGHWCNGIVNAWIPPKHDLSAGELLIAAPGHAKSNTVIVEVRGYGKHWRYSTDDEKRGAKPVALSDLVG